MMIVCHITLCLWRSQTILVAQACHLQGENCTSTTSWSVLLARSNQRWLGHLKHVGDMNCSNSFSWNLQGRGRFGGLDGRTILKCISMKEHIRVKNRFIDSDEISLQKRICFVASSFLWRISIYGTTWKILAGNYAQTNECISGEVDNLKTLTLGKGKGFPTNLMSLLGFQEVKTPGSFRHSARWRR